MATTQTLYLSKEVYNAIEASRRAGDWIHDMSVKEQMGAKRWQDNQADIEQLSASIDSIGSLRGAGMQVGGVRTTGDRYGSKVWDPRKMREIRQQQQRATKPSSVDEFRKLLFSSTARTIERNDVEDTNYQFFILGIDQEKDFITIYLLLALELFRNALAFDPTISIINVFFSDLLADKLKLYMVLYNMIGIEEIKNIIYNNDDIKFYNSEDGTFIGTMDGLDLFYSINADGTILQTPWAETDRLDDDIERIRMNFFANYLDFGNINDPNDQIARIFTAYEFYIYDLNSLRNEVPINFTEPVPMPVPMPVLVPAFTPAFPGVFAHPVTVGGGSKDIIQYGGVTSDQCTALKGALENILANFKNTYTNGGVPDRNAFLELVVTAFMSNGVTLTPSQRSYLYGCYPDSNPRSSARGNSFTKYETVELRIRELWGKHCNKIMDQAAKAARKAENDARIAAAGELTQEQRDNANNLNICIARMVLCLVGACQVDGVGIPGAAGNNFFAKAQFAILQNIAWRRNDFGVGLPAGNLDDKLEELVRQHIVRESAVDDLKKAFVNGLDMPRDNKKVAINNAANVSALKEETSVTTKDWRNKVFCTTGSVLDAMSLCPGSSIGTNSYEWGENFSVTVTTAPNEGASFSLTANTVPTSQQITIIATSTFPYSTIGVVPQLVTTITTNVETGKELTARIVLRGVIVKLLEYYNSKTAGGTDNAYFAPGFWQKLWLDDKVYLFDLLKYTLPKYIGDGKQELEALMKYGGYIGPGVQYNNPNAVAEFDAVGYMTRVFFANDRPSAIRFIIMCILALEGSDINDYTRGGYVGPKSTLLVSRPRMLRANRRQDLVNRYAGGNKRKHKKKTNKKKNTKRYRLKQNRKTRKKSISRKDIEKQIK